MSESGDTCWRSSCSFLGKLDPNYKRSMGSKNSKRRLQIRIFGKNSSNRYKKYKCTCTRYANSSFRSRSTFWKKRYRKSSESTKTKRFLQHIFSCSKKDRRFETCHKSQTSKQASPKETFQDGFFKQCNKSSSERRLGSFSRSQRRIFSHSNSGNAQTVLKILHKQTKLPISSSLFRPDQRSSGVQQSLFSSCSTSESTKHTFSSLPRRLACSKSRSRKTLCRQRESSQSPDKSRFYDKFGKIKHRTNSENNIHRGCFSVDSRYCSTYRRKNTKTYLRGKCHLKQTKSSNSKRFSTLVRYYGFMHRADPKCKAVYETNTTSSSLSLETSQSELVKENSIFKSSKGTSSLVVKQKKSFQREINNSMGNLSNRDDRCVTIGIRGSHFQQSNGSRGLVGKGKETTHKLLRNGSSLSHGKTLPTNIEKSKCPDSLRQFHSCQIHRKTRRDSFPRTVHENMETLASCNRQRHSASISPHRRKEKCSGRQFVKNQNTTNRMVLEQSNSSVIVSDMGNASDRSVCLGEKSSDSHILCLESRSKSLCNRCSIDTMGQHVCLCVPSNLPNSKNFTTSEPISMSNHSDSPTLAKETMVSQPSEISSRLSKSSTSQGGSTTPAKHTNLSPKSSSVQINCMDVIDRKFKEKGFSKETRKLLRASWRKGTQKDYSVKFRKFSSWCSGREIDPYCATLTDVAEFLTFLFSKGLQYRTIAGYRSMLSSVVPTVENIPVGKHPFITRLIKGVFHSRPPKVVLTPEWDLPLVLRKLKQAPFEPLKHVHLKYVCWKTAFLIAITSFRRCSDIQSLCIGEENITVQKKGLTFLRKGLSKQDRPSHFGSKIFIPAFPSDKLLDPKRSFYYYLKRTDEFRKTDDKFVNNLFLSFRSPHNPVSAQTISSWIVKTIKCAYGEESKDTKFRAHATRALGPTWALFNGASVKSIMETADWSKDSTFTRFYLRQLEPEVLKSV